MAHVARRTNPVHAINNTVYFINMTKLNDMAYSEYLHIAHDIKETTGAEDNVKDMGINLSDFLADPRSLSHVLRLSPYTKEKWGGSNKIRIGRII